MDNFYAGIGARKAPSDVLAIMMTIGTLMATNGWILRSGGASGSDAAFEEGALRANGKTEIYLPWRGFNFHNSRLHPVNYPFTDSETEMSKMLHPKWDILGPSDRLLHKRNIRELIGLRELHGEVVQPVKFVICWTEKGRTKGGTGQAIRAARALDIPVINIGAPEYASTNIIERIMDLAEKLKDKRIIR